MSKFPVIARPVRRLVVAIPRIERKRTEKHPEEWDSPQFLMVIVTWFLSTGGLPRQCAHWLAMTALFQVRTCKQQFTVPPRGYWVGAVVSGAAAVVGAVVAAVVGVVVGVVVRVSGIRKPWIFPLAAVSVMSPPMTLFL